MTFTSSIRVRTRVARKQRRSGLSKSVLIGIEIAVPILLLAVWWLASLGSNNAFFPPLKTILARFGVLVTTQEFWVDLGSSVSNLLISFLLACVIGVLLGLALGMSRLLSWTVEPVIHFFRAIPPVALVPIFVSLIGFGNETRILSITIAAVFPVLISTIDGVRGVDPALGMVGKVYRFGWTDRIFAVTLPAASPRILSGVQVALITAYVVMIASEMLGSSTGLGSATLEAQQSFMIADMWVGILVLGVIGYGTTALYTLFRRRVLRWYISAQEQEKTL